MTDTMDTMNTTPNPSTLALLSGLMVPSSLHEPAKQTTPLALTYVAGELRVTKGDTVCVCVQNPCAELRCGHVPN